MKLLITLIAPAVVVLQRETPQEAWVAAQDIRSDIKHGLLNEALNMQSVRHTTFDHMVSWSASFV